MKKVYMISTSMRKNGNSDQLADEFIKGAIDAGHQVNKSSLADKTIQFCKGCLACQKTQSCILKDDVNDIINEMKDADIIVFATPIYFYEMCGQMKTLLDRTNPLFSNDYHFRDIYLIATCADEEESAIDGCITGLNGWIQCFEETSLKGAIKGLGLTDVQDVRKNQELLQEAYILGKNI